MPTNYAVEDEGDTVESVFCQYVLGETAWRHPVCLPMQRQPNLSLVDSSEDQRP